MGRIRCTINYEVKLKQKFEDFLDRFQAEIGVEFQELKIDRYRKIEGQFQASFFIEINLIEKEKLIYQTLVMANKLWPTGYSNWTVNGPHENEALVFECFLNNANDDQSLKWAHLELTRE